MMARLWGVPPKLALARNNRRLQGRRVRPISDSMTVSLTQSAAARVAAIATKLGKPAILRLSVDGGGCSGFQYRFGLADLIESDDEITTLGDVSLVVDRVSLDLVDGSAVDFVESLGGAAFKVTNPNAASGCGCGASFSV